MFNGTYSYAIGATTLLKEALVDFLSQKTVTAWVEVMAQLMYLEARLRQYADEVGIEWTLAAVQDRHRRIIEKCEEAGATPRDGDRWLISDEKPQKKSLRDDRRVEEGTQEDRAVDPPQPDITSRLWYGE